MPKFRYHHALLALRKAHQQLRELFCLVFFAAYAFLLFQDKHLTEEVWGIVASSNIFFMCISRLPRSGLTSRTSPLASCLLHLLPLVRRQRCRLGTVLVETSDLLFQLQFIMAVLLNGIIVLQFFLYWNNKKVDQAKGKKEVNAAGKPKETKKT